MRVELTREEAERLFACIGAGLSEDTVETPAPFALKTARAKLRASLDSEHVEDCTCPTDHRSAQCPIHGHHRKGTEGGSRRAGADECDGSGERPEVVGDAKSLSQEMVSCDCPRCQPVEGGRPELEALLLDVDGPVRLELREAIGDMVGAYEWRDAEGEALAPNDPSLERLADAVDARVAGALRVALASTQPQPDQAPEGAGDDLLRASAVEAYLHDAREPRDISHLLEGAPKPIRRPVIELEPTDVGGATDA